MKYRISQGEYSGFESLNSNIYLNRNTLIDLIGEQSPYLEEIDNLFNQEPEWLKGKLEDAKKSEKESEEEYSHRSIHYLLRNAPEEIKEWAREIMERAPEDGGLGGPEIN